VKGKETTYQFVSDAYRAFKKKEYPVAETLLEKVISSGSREPYVFFLLSAACLHSSRFDLADRTMDRLRALSPEYIPLIQLQLFLELKSAPTFESILARYLDAIEKFPADPHILRGRKLISYAGNFTEFQKSASMADFVYIPPPPKHLKKAMDAGVRGKKPAPVRVGPFTMSRRKRGPALSLKKALVIIIPLVLFLSGIILLARKYSDIKGFPYLGKPWFHRIRQCGARGASLYQPDHALLPRAAHLYRSAVPLSGRARVGHGGTAHVKP